jgi:hypothetical protein
LRCYSEFMNSHFMNSWFEDFWEAENCMDNYRICILSLWVNPIPLDLWDFYWSRDKHPQMGIILACMANVYACRGSKGTSDIVIIEVSCVVQSSNMTRPSIHPSIRPIIHPWHGGDNHVAINFIV